MNLINFSVKMMKLILNYFDLFSETNVKKATTNVSATAATVKMTNNNNSANMKGKEKSFLFENYVAYFLRNILVDKRRFFYFELLSLSVTSHDEFKNEL